MDGLCRCLYLCNLFDTGRKGVTGITAQTEAESETGTETEAETGAEAETETGTETEAEAGSETEVGGWR